MRQKLRRWLFRFLAAVLVVGAAYTVYLDWRVTSAFEGKRWEIPARVYARPLELYEGRALSWDNLLLELRAADYRQAGKGVEPGTFRRRGDELVLTSRSFDFADGSEPSTRIRMQLRGGRISALRQYADGRALPLVRLDPAEIGSIYPLHGEDRVLVRLEDVPETLLAGLVAVEDRGFYEHHGLSFRGIARAMIANLKAGRVVQGGSTLTQQLVKNFYLNNKRTLWRKGNEAVMALLLEWHYDKDEILQAYLNEVYLAQDGGRAIHGFGLASRHFFAKPLADLSLHQQALLIGMVKGPTVYNPLRQSKQARDRRNLVLQLMQQDGVISEAEARQAAAKPLDVAGDEVGREAMPAFLDLVRRHLRRDYDSDDLSSEGLRIFTTLEPYVQARAERALSRRLDGWGNDALEGAVVAINTNDGSVLSMVGGRDPRFAGFNRALDARRPVGSLIKPAVYLTALQWRDGYGLGSLLPDEPITLTDDIGQVWEPENYDGEYRGKVPLWYALTRSLNLPTVHLGLDVGLPSVARTLQQLGLDTPRTLYPSMLLGTLEYSPYQMAEMYQVLASGGFKTPLRSVTAVMRSNGEVLNRYSLKVTRAMPRDVAYLMNYLLRAVVEQGTAKGLSHWLPADLAVAGKTGTTDDMRDSWFAGFSGDTLAVVWVGRDDNGQTGLTGASGAMTVFGQLFADLHTRPLDLSPPEGVRSVWIEATTGLLAKPSCGMVVELPYLEDAMPAESPCIARRGPLDKASDWFRELME